MSEQYYWEIQFPNGTKENQLNSDGTENRLDFQKLESQEKFIFSLVAANQVSPTIQLMIDNKKRLICFRRRVKSMNLSTGEHRLLKTIYAVGWQKTISGENIKNIIWIDGETNQIYSCDDLAIKNGVN